MKRIETSVVIQMPIDQVFAYLIEPAKLPEWIFGYMAGKNIDKYGSALKKRLEETG